MVRCFGAGERRFCSLQLLSTLDTTFLISSPEQTKNDDDKPNNRLLHAYPHVLPRLRHGGMFVILSNTSFPRSLIIATAANPTTSPHHPPLKPRRLLRRRRFRGRHRRDRIPNLPRRSRHRGCSRSQGIQL